jgi:hypothetical protein
MNALPRWIRLWLLRRGWGTYYIQTCWDNRNWTGSRYLANGVWHLQRLNPIWREVAYWAMWLWTYRYRREMVRLLTERLGQNQTAK